LGSVDGTELVPAGSLQAASGGDLTPGRQLISHDLGVPSFFSNLQYCGIFWPDFYTIRTAANTLICSPYQTLVDGMASQLRLQGAPVLEGASSLARWNPVLLQHRVSDLEAMNAG
jgi:hypothetical protein